MMEVTLTPIGVVRAARQRPEDDAWGGSEAEIQLRPELPEDALVGLEAFSHAVHESGGDFCIEATPAERSGRAQHTAQPEPMHAPSGALRGGPEALEIRYGISLRGEQRHISRTGLWPRPGRVLSNDVSNSGSRSASH